MRLVLSQLVMRFPKLLSSMRAAQPAYDRPLLNRLTTDHYSAGAYLLNKHLILFHPSSPTLHI